MTPELKKLQKILNISDETIRYNKKFFESLGISINMIDDFDDNDIQEVINYVKENYNWVYAEKVFMSVDGESNKLMIYGLSQSVTTEELRVIHFGNVDDGVIGVSFLANPIIEIKDSQGSITNGISMIYSKKAEDIQVTIDQLTADNITGWQSNLTPTP